MLPNYQIIMYGIGIGGAVFGVYSYFRNPQINSEKAESIMGLNIIQLQKDFANLRDNHVHSIDLKLDEQGKSIRDLLIQTTRLSTIIEERIPRKTE